MTPADLVDVLEHLPFRDGPLNQAGKWPSLRLRLRTDRLLVEILPSFLPNPARFISMMEFGDEGRSVD
jgi:hypothetical protein